MSHIFHVSDLHFGREDRVAIDWFAAMVRAERPSAILITGDLTMRARAHEYAAASAWLGTLGTPMSIDVGNHDLPYYNLFHRFVTPYSRYDRVEKALERPLELTDVTTVPLKTTARAQWRTNWSHGVVRPRRLAVAIEAVRAIPDHHIRLVTTHHPLIDRPGGEAEGRTRGGLDALHALADAGADLILSGHVHDPFDIVWEKGSRPVRLIGAGTLSERIRSTAPSYNDIKIDNGKVEVAVRTMN